MKLAGKMIVTFALLPLGGVLGEDASTAEEIIPKGFPQSRYEPVWARNPFELATPPSSQPQEAESFAKNLSISSVMRIGSKVSIQLFDKSTKSYHRVSQEPNADGMRLLSLAENPDPRNVTAEIGKGTETATVRYDGTRILAAATPSAGRGNSGETAGKGTSGPKEKATSAIESPEDRRLNRTVPVATAPESHETMAEGKPSSEAPPEVKKSPEPDQRRKIILPKKMSGPAS